MSGTVATSHFLPQQQAMFVAEQLLGPGIYNIGWQFQFSGVDSNILFDCLDELIQAHPILRMTISDPSEGDLDNATILTANPVRRADCSSLDDIKALTRETIKRPYAFGSHPLARFALGALGNETYICIAAHHALLDQWSSRLLFQELMERYHVVVQGKAYSSRISDFHSSDDVGWQKESNGRVAFADRFHGYPDVISIVPDKSRPAFPWKRVEIRSRMLDPGAMASVYETAKTLCTTPFFLGFAAFSLVLGRYSRRQRFVVGFPFHGRMAEMEQRVLSATAALIPVPIDADPRQSIEQFIRAIQEASWQGVAEGPACFGGVLRALPTMPSFERHPLAQYCFVQIVRATDRQTIEHSVRGKIDDFVGSASPFDMKIYLDQRPDEMVLYAEFSPDLISCGTATRFLDHMVKAVDWITSTSSDSALNAFQDSGPID